MPIIFPCPHCHHRLRTPDSKAGHSARCPSCRNAIWVPYESSEEDEESLDPTMASGGPTSAPDNASDTATDDGPVDGSEEDIEDFVEEDFVEEDFPEGARPNPDDFTVEILCDECGAENPSTARRCAACGARLFDHRAQPEPRSGDTFDLSEVVSTSFTIYGQTMTWLLVAAVVQICIVWLLWIVFVGAALFAGIALRDERAIALAAVLAFPVALLMTSAAWIGTARLYLNAVRDGHVRLEDLFYAFGDGRHLLARGTAVVLAWCLIVALGFLFCILPGFLIMMVSWPMMRILVEEEPPELETISRTYEFVRREFVNVLLVGLVVIGANLVVQSALACLGFIPIFGSLLQFSAYLMISTIFEVFYSVAYLRLTRQPTLLETEAYRRR